MNIQKLRQERIEKGERVYSNSGDYHNDYVRCLEELLERYDNSDYTLLLELVDDLITFTKEAPAEYSNGPGFSGIDLEYVSPEDKIKNFDKRREVLKNGRV